MDILTKYHTVKKNGHEIKVPEGTEIFELDEKVVVLHRFGTVTIFMRDVFVELNVNFHNGYKSAFLFNNKDKSVFEFGYKSLNVLFNNRVVVTKKLRNMLTQSLKIYLLPLDPSDPDYNDGRRYYTVDEQKVKRNAGKAKKSQASRENSEDIKTEQHNPFDNNYLNVDISMEAAFSVM